MNSYWYPLYQVLGWLMLYLGLVFAVSKQPGFSSIEFVFALALVGTAAIWSHLLRSVYKRFLKTVAFWWQAPYFVLGALLGGALAAAVLVAMVFALSHFGLIDPINPQHRAFVASTVFWPNGINMTLALLLWSAIYLAITRTRMLRDAQQVLASTQMEVLTRQLQPHFLFNLLNNIRALIIENPSRARDAIAQLADLLRYTLRQDQQTKVTLAEELTMLEDYIGLCQTQFEGRLSFELVADTDLQDYLIPKLLLQQCVENAIKHGISQRRDGGTISVKIVGSNEHMMIIVTNPLPQQRLKNSDSTGTGMHNSMERLRLLYGRKASIQLDLGTGTAKTKIVLPLEKSDEAQQ